MERQHRYAIKGGLSKKVFIVTMIQTREDYDSIYISTKNIEFLIYITVDSKPHK
jgi:hypothetical protein